MKTVKLSLGAASYDIVIAEDLLSLPSFITDVLVQPSVAIVTNATVASLYLHELEKQLRSLNVNVINIVLPDGESYKTWDTLNSIIGCLLEHRFERKSTIIALGGGVVGDMAGFAAAIYQRGVPFIQIPTTLLAQVDSSVGGKTAVNHPLGKNMIGAFHQPRRVIIDLLTLKSLPDREFSAGLAEVIKYGLICDQAFFDWLELNMHLLMSRDMDALAFAIERSCTNKATVVMADEREQGIRAHLNFGHTFGHAIEAGLGYGCWLHGEAVAVGMILATKASILSGSLGAGALHRISSLCEAAGLPLAAPVLGFNKWMELMAQDKKVEAGNIRFILLNDIGNAFVGPLDEPILRNLLK